MSHRSLSLAFPLAAALTLPAAGALVQITPPNETSNTDETQINDTQREIQNVLSMPFDGAPFEDAKRLDDLVERLTTGVDTHVERELGTVMLFVRIPDLQNMALEFSVDERCVHLTYAHQEPPGTAHEWRFYQPRTMCVPVPKDADYATAQVAQSQDTFSVVFKQKE